MRVLFVASIALTGIGSAVAIRIVPNSRVPLEYRQTVFDPPNGEPEPVRYKKAYEAFWWNCVFVRANDPRDRCPFTCSGTPAAVGGCANGAGDADSAIDLAIKQHGADEVVPYLKSLTKSRGAKEKLKPYFPDGPTPESQRK
jgi:hypothetical protein